MDRPSLILTLLILITAVSFCGLYLHQEDTRSDLTALTPYSITDRDASGSLDVGGESYPHILADAIFGVDIVDDGRSHCWTELSFSRSSFGPYNHLKFDFWTMKGTQAPEGSVWAFTAGNESRYVYDDPLTGTELTFYLVNDMVNKIVYKGKTVNEFNGELEYVSFDIEASFDKDIVFVNDVMMGKVPEPLELRISGMENETTMHGTLKIEPLSCIIRNGGYEAVMASATLNVPGSHLPDSMMVSIVKLSDGYRFTEQNVRMQYLDSEGNYIDQIIDYRLSNENGFTLVLNGTITSSVLDPGCNIIEHSVFKFDYGVVE